MKTILNTDNTPQSASQGVIADNIIFISGQIGNDPISEKLISLDIESETKQAMENIKSILSGAKVNFSHIVKTSIYLTDMNDWGRVNKVYASYFTGEFPSCEIFEASALPLNAHVEISMIASNK